MATITTIEENIRYYTHEAQKAAERGQETTAKAYDRLIESNIKKLEELKSEERAKAKKNSDDASRCSGCGQSFNGLRGLRSHQSQKFATAACKAVR